MSFKLPQRKKRSLREREAEALKAAPPESGLTPNLQPLMRAALKRAQRRQAGKKPGVADLTEEWLDQCRRNLNRVPRNEAEHKQLMGFCRRHARAEGWPNHARAVRAEQLYAMAVEQAKRLVQAPKPGQGIVVPAKPKDTTPRSASGLIILPGGPALITPP